MRKIKTDLKKRGVYFSTKLPSLNQILKILNITGQNSDMYGPVCPVTLNSYPVKKQGQLIAKRNQDGKKKTTEETNVTLLVICDRKLQSRKEVKAWLKNYLVYFVSAGEPLKSLDSFPMHVNNILKKAKNKKICGLISLGGGSVGDFTGFLASVYKRGVPLVHIPTTWLSAMDSSHGGKTALNIGQVKNAIGSYWFPGAVFIVKGLLLHLPEKEKQSAKGELIKIALIEGGAFYTELLAKNKYSDLVLWRFLPQAILAKLKIVEKDPYEKKGQRGLLNFGHTIGHVLESYFGLSHGKAVLYGIAFSIRWSHKRFILSASFFKQMSVLKGTKRPLQTYLKKIPPEVLYKLLLHDKKRAGDRRINFVFVKGPGQVFMDSVSIQDILTEIKLLSHSG